MGSRILHLLLGTLCLIFPIGPIFAQGMGSSAKAIPRSSPRAETDLPTPKIEFRDISSAIGLTAPNVYGGENKKRFILEMTGNGVAVFDFDNDGWRDILLVNGTRFDLQQSQPKARHQLYRNKGDGSFEDVTEGSGLKNAGWGQGVCAGDFDNDGRVDLLLTYYGQNVLYRNRGNGAFQDISADAGLPTTRHRWNTGCTFLDYDRDGLLDIFVSNYVRFEIEETLQPGANPFCFWRGLAVFCGPKGFPGGQNLLYHNEGEGRFRDVSKQAGITLPGLHYGLGAISSDLDGDGWPDIYVACDSTPSILYRNNRDGTFTDVAVEAGVAYGDAGQEEGSMGVAVGDYDNNGRLDIVKTNFMDETSTLYHNQGGWFFEDVTYLAGLGVNTKYVGWGIQFLDIDQDGWKDILVANGHIYPELSGAGKGEDYRQGKILYWNLRNGSFRDVTNSAGMPLTTPSVSRGMATGDLDGDGVPEVVVVNMNAPPAVLENTSEKGNAILVELVGTESNRSAIGARVTVKADSRAQHDEVRSGSSYASQSDFRLHFGLGDADSADEIQVRWPNGLVEKYLNVKANQSVKIREGDGIIHRVPFAESKL